MTKSSSAIFLTSIQQNVVMEWLFSVPTTSQEINLEFWSCVNTELEDLVLSGGLVHLDYKTLNWGNLLSHAALVVCLISRTNTWQQFMCDRAVHHGGWNCRVLVAGAYSGCLLYDINQKEVQPKLDQSIPITCSPSNLPFSLPTLYLLQLQSPP